MNYEEVNNWVSTYRNGANPFPQEERPYRKCHNCGRNKLRWSRRLEQSILFIRPSRYIYQEYCSNCKYSSDIIKKETE